MNKVIKHGLLPTAIVVGLSLLVLSLLNADAKLTGKKNPSLTIEKPKAPLPGIAKPQLTSNPRQIVTLGNTTNEGSGLEPSSATQSCYLQWTGLTEAEMDPYKGGQDCTTLPSQTITESTFNNFTYSGGRINWWGIWTYGTMFSGVGTCENPPLVVQSAIPLSHIALFAHCRTIGSTITFTPNDGNVVQTTCGPFGQSADAYIYGNNITQVTVTAVPNDGFYLDSWGGNPAASIRFIESQPCNCPTIPVVP